MYIIIRTSAKCVFGMTKNQYLACCKDLLVWTCESMSFCLIQFSKLFPVTGFHLIFLCLSHVRYGCKHIVDTRPIIPVYKMNASVLMLQFFEANQCLADFTNSGLSYLPYHLQFPEMCWWHAPWTSKVATEKLENPLGLFYVIANVR